MTARPLCRYCGKPIAKRTTRVNFVDTQERADRDNASGWTWQRSVVGTPRTKIDAQRLTNQEIVHVSRGLFVGGKYDEQFIGWVSVWDGSSYADPFFCNGGHANHFAYSVARDRPGLAMPAYHDAVKARSALSKND